MFSVLDAIRRDSWRRLNCVVIQIFDHQSATVLTASQAERLAVYLMRQASAARQVNREAADASFAPALAAWQGSAGDSIQQRREEQA